MSTITKPQLTVEQYESMIESGTIGEDDPLELIGGKLVQKMPRNPPHRVGTRKTARATRSHPAGTSKFRRRSSARTANPSPTSPWCRRSWNTTRPAIRKPRSAA